MLAAAKALVPTQEEMLAKGYIESGDFMCTWGWLWSQRCLRFIGICKINKQLSKERMSVVWDVVDEKYVF